MTKKGKILITSMALASVVSVPLIVTSSIIFNQKKVSKSKYLFDNQTFESQQSALLYAASKADSYYKETKTPIEWSINDNNKLITFDSYNSAVEYLKRFIEKKEYTSYTNNLKTDSIGALELNEISKMNFSDVTKKTVYRGKNNSIYTSEESAKKSYFEIHEVYYFDGIYFRTKEELAVWLEKNMQNYQNNKNKSTYEIVLENGNGATSMPIKLDELKEFYSTHQDSDIPYQVDNFVKANAIPYFKYHDKVLNKDIFVNTDDAENELIKNFNPSFVKLISNGAKGNYLVDTSTEDKAELFGPYYVKSGSEILDMDDRSKWRKLEGTDHQIVDQMRQNELVSKFMNLILAVPSESANEQLFNSKETSELKIYEIPDIQFQIDEYFKTIQKDLPKIYNSIVNLYKNMKNGKRYGEFLKTPILFVHTIDQLIYYNAPQKYIDMTREIYTLICEYFDTQLYSIVPEIFLLEENNQKKFSFVDLFKVNNQSLDINYDVESLIGEIINNYPYLFEFIQFLTNYEMYSSKLNLSKGIGFSYEYFEDAFDMTFDYTKDANNIENENSFLVGYKLVWNTLNSKDITDLYNNTNAINSNDRDSKPYYYLYNFLNQQSTNNISKTIINYWLDKETAIEKFKLKLEQIQILEQIAIPSSKNEVFLFPTSTYSNDNYNYLKEIYLNNGKDIDPILFTRLIMYAQYYNNSKSLRQLLNGTYKINEMYEKINQFIVDKFLSDFNNLSDLNTPIFSKANVNYSTVSNIEIPIKLPDNITTTRKVDDPEKFNEKMGKMYNSITSIFATVGEIAYGDGPKDGWAITQTVFSIMGNLCDLLSVACPWFAIGSIICDFICNFYKKETFSYIFETEDVKYIWNGGMQESYLFGMIPGNSITIEDMKLIPPIEVVRPNNIQGLYYNGEVFDTEDALKNKQLNDILNNRYNNSDLTKVYSLVDLKNNDILSNDNLQYYYDEKINNLSTKFSKHLENEIIVNSSFQNNPVIKEGSYKFGSFVYDNNLTLKENIDSVLKNIKPTFVAQIPKLNDSNSIYSKMPIFNDANNNDDNSLLPYKLPGKSWTSTGGYQTNNEMSFIIQDQNPKNDQTSKIINPKKQLEQDFYNSFSVPSKVVDEKFINSTTLYSELSTKIESNSCFVATGKNNNRKVFLNLNDAIKWLASETEFDLQTHYHMEVVQPYFYNGLAFGSYQEFANWVLNNIKREE